MEQLINRLLGNPVVLIMAGGVFGFWLIGETSRRVTTSQSKQQQEEAAQTVALNELLAMMRQQREELEALRREMLESGLPGPSETPVAAGPQEVKRDAGLDGSAGGDRSAG